MHFHYSQKHIKSYKRTATFLVVSGIALFLLFGSFGVYKLLVFEAMGFGNLVCGLLLFAYTLYIKKTPYLSYSNGVLTKNTLIPKKFDFSTLKVRTIYAGDMRLISKTEAFEINTNIMRSEDKSALKKLVSQEIEKQK